MAGSLKGLRAARPEHRLQCTLSAAYLDRACVASCMIGRRSKSGIRLFPGDGDSPAHSACPTMFLYNLSLIPPSSITAAIVGNFSPLTRQQQILVCRGGSRLELLQVDAATGRATSLLVTEAYGVVRAIAPFRLTGGSKGQLALFHAAHKSSRGAVADYIIVSSDSGRVVVLEYDPAANVLVKLQQETYGKSGVRRTVPGQYLAVDPKGRSIMLGAVDKSKLFVTSPLQQRCTGRVRRTGSTS